MNTAICFTVTDLLAEYERLGLATPGTTLCFGSNHGASAPCG